MNVAFAREPLRDRLWDEALPLLVAHWREIAHYQDIPLDPDQAIYQSAADAGILRCYTVRRDASDRGELMGYAIFFVRPNPHYCSSLQAVQDVLYISPSARGTTGYRFIRWCDEQLRAEGVQAVYHHVKAAHNFGRMLERLGYECVDLIYARRLD